MSQRILSSSYSKLSRAIAKKRLKNASNQRRQTRIRRRMDSVREKMIHLKDLAIGLPLTMLALNATAKPGVMMMIIVKHMNLIALRKSVTIGSRTPREMKLLVSRDASSRRVTRRRRSQHTLKYQRPKYSLNLNLMLRLRR